MKKTDVYIEPIAYRTDSATYFSCFKHLPWSVFLDSGYPHMAQGRFDIITASPVLTLHAQHGQISVTRGTQQWYETGDPLAILRQYTPSIAPISEYHLPFYGGAIGYLAYEFAGYLEGLYAPQAVAHHKLPDMMVGIYDWAIIVDHHTQQAFLVMLDVYHDVQALRDRVKDSLNKCAVYVEDTFTLCDDLKSNITYEQYGRAFSTIQKHLLHGESYQVNFTQCFSAAYRGEPWLAYCDLRRLNPAPFSAFLHYPKGDILSLSPERFIKKEGANVKMQPIKGTSARGHDKKSDRKLAEILCASEKDRAENVMIVDLLRNDLSRVCQSGSVKVKKLCELMSLPSVHHLESTIEGVLDDAMDGYDLIRTCFPSGSITGAPKYNTMRIIDALETQKRSVYCGSIFYMDSTSKMDSNVSIRTLMCCDNHLFCPSGGGITVASTLEGEYQETLDKISFITQYLKETRA